MLQDIIGAKKDLFADGVQTVLRGQENRTRRVVLLKGNLVQNSRSEGAGINARVNHHGTFGFASIAEYTPEAAEKVIRAATENALALGKHSGRNTALPGSYGTGIIPLNTEIADAEQKELIEMCRTVDQYIAGKYPDLASRTVVYYEDSQDRIVCSSDAYNGHLITPRCYVYVMMSAETKNGVPVELFKAFGGFGSFYDHFRNPETLYPGIDALYKKLMDKKELKATNSQTIELTPVYMVNHADHFTKAYRNVIVLKKLTFPEEKKLRLEITEDQISGRVSYLDINYRDILNADSFAPELLINLQ